MSAAVVLNAESGKMFLSALGAHGYGQRFMT